MGWDEVPGGVPLVSMACPDTTICGQTITLIVSCSNYPGNITLTVKNADTNVTEFCQTIYANAGTNVSFSIPDTIPVGTYGIYVVGTNSYGTGLTTYCSWFVVNCDESNEDSPYYGFKITQFRCNGGDWQEALCHENAIINWKRAGNVTQWDDLLSNFEWRASPNCSSTHNFIPTPHNQDVYIALIHNNGIPWYHAVVAEKIGTNINDICSWKFIQFGNTNIPIGNWQIPFGVGNYNTCLDIINISLITASGCDLDYKGSLVVNFLIDNLGNATASTTSCPSDQHII